MVDWNDVGAETGRFTLGEDGQIFWQTNKTNPLPGDLIAVIEKGDASLQPKAAVIATDAPNDIQEKVVTWLHAHIREVLAPLFVMIDQDAEENRLDGPALNIGQKLFDAMGVIHRSDLESDIPNLTAEHRTALRRKRVKLGPILVFMPELVKPAAVNMRALLHGLWNAKTLPMERPADGRVSVTVDAEVVDRNYFRSIGYPVFGNKAIRIDMLDRVITDIYDSSKDWQFQAKHQYMEWLGCGEDDLYAILQSMGFRRQAVEEGAQKPEEKVQKENDAVVTTEKVVEPAATSEVEKVASEAQSDLFASTEAPTTETEENVEQPKTQTEKPPLVMFWLKKGKISDRPKPKRHTNHKQNDKKPFKGKKKKGGDQHREPKAKNYSAKPKESEIDNDSPFAILQQLKN